MAERTTPGGDNLSTVASQYRTVAGLPERDSDAPRTSGTEVSELRRQPEPEGGYDGRGETEPETPEDLGVDPETGLTGGETATEVARVTGEDTPDVKPAPEVVDGDVEDDETDEEQ